MNKISIDGIDIKVVSKNEDDFICLTHMVANHVDGSKLIEKWLTLKGTIDFLGAWETLNNPDFNSPEFRGIRSDAGSNAFFMSVKQWINRTGAIGLANTKDIELALAESPHKQKESTHLVDSDAAASIDKLLPGLLSVPPPKKDNK